MSTSSASGEAAGTSLKSKVIAKFARHAQDVGSPEVQIALLTSRLDYLTKHLASNPNDIHCRRGMLAIVSKRKKLLQFLKDDQVDQYKKTVNALGLRK